MATLKELQDAVANAQHQYDVSLDLASQHRTEAQNSYNAIATCVNGKGSGTPLGGIGFGFGMIGNTGDCKEPPFVANCKTNCCSKNTCVSRISDYNSRLGIYNNSLGASNDFKTKLNTANTNLSNFVASDPGTQASIASAKNKNTIWFILAVIAAILIGWFIYKKYSK